MVWLRCWGRAGGRGWSLSPAYDMNPDPNGYGLKLNICETDNSMDLALALEVAKYFRLGDERADALARSVVDVVKGWRELASAHGLPDQVDRNSVV